MAPPTFHRLRFVALGLASAIVGGACAPPDPSPPNLILITVDTLRPDHLEPYGSGGVPTPAIARLAAEGIVFENAVCDTTWTVPSMASVTTGHYPTRHRVRTFRDRLPESATTLAELLREHGYTTAAIVGSLPLHRRFGMAQGFSSYDDEMTTPLDEEFGVIAKEIVGEEHAQLRWILEGFGSKGYRPDDVLADSAIAWLRAPRSGPFFLWVHFFGPHEKPHRLGRGAHPFEKIALLKNRKLYDEDVSFMDRHVGRLIEAALHGPDGAQTAIVFHSDHGQTFDEHGFPGHGFDLFDTSARVPLIVRLPGSERAGERVTRLVRNLDIFATLLRLAGVPPPPGLASHDLLEEGAPEEIYIESYLGMDANPVQSALRGGSGRRVILRAVRTPEWKLIVRDVIPPSDQGVKNSEAPNERQAMLYDLETDPGEQRDVASEHPDTVAWLMDALRRFDTPDAEGAPSGVYDDPYAVEQLRSLGYLE